jgi:hypothetical protein
MIVVSCLGLIALICSLFIIHFPCFKARHPAPNPNALASASGHLLRHPFANLSREMKESLSMSALESDDEEDENTTSVLPDAASDRFRVRKSSAVALEAAASLGRRMSDAVRGDVGGALGLGAEDQEQVMEGGDDDLKGTVLQREIVASPAALPMEGGGEQIFSFDFIIILLIHHPWQEQKKL